MNIKKHFLSTMALVAVVICLMAAMTAADELKMPDENPVADVTIGASGITWLPKTSYGELVLTVAKPDGTVFTRSFQSGTTPALELSGEFMDGTYTYELLVVPLVQPRVRQKVDGSGITPFLKPLTQTGYFTVQAGAIVTPGGQERLARPQDVLHYDDVIITGSLCVGFDCQNGESFGFDTIILKEHNLRIYFNDTSYTASYPTNNWRITINDSTNGGASYFSVDDVDDGTSIFKIEAGAPSNSLYVEDYGRIGFGTSTPVVELHVKDSDTPTLRLEQDSSGGWTAQTWDVAGNESNFFIRDATNGSKLPFRIQPGTPSSTLCLKSDGKVGIGTWSPSAQFELETTGENAAVIFERTDGATGKFTARPSEVYIGSGSGHNVRIVANNNVVMTVEPGGDVGIGNTNPTHLIDVGTSGAYCDGGGWVDGSSIDYKENVRTLTSEEAMATLEVLTPVKFNYKADKTEEWLGFIAEDVPDLVATKERKGMSPMDVVAVLTKAVQEQQKIMNRQQQTISRLNERIEELEKKL